MLIEIDRRTGAGSDAQAVAWAGTVDAIRHLAEAPSRPLPGGAEDGSRPLVDVLITTFNREKTVGATLTSIYNQEYKYFRVIVVDDGSTDRTCEVVRTFADRQQPLLLVRAAHSGVVGALNEGIGYIAAPLTARADSDDIFFPKRFGDQVAFLLANHEHVAVSSCFYQIDSDGVLTGVEHNDHGDRYFDWFEYPAREPYLPHTFLMIRSDLLKTLKYRHLHHCEDSDLYWRAVAHGRLATMWQKHGCYRVHTDSITGRNVVEGRVQAVFTQLSAISIRRTLVLRPDIEFDKAGLEAMRSKVALEPMIDSCRPILDQKEFDYLKIAAAMKLVELTGYRPYELELADIEFFLGRIDLEKIGNGDHRRGARRAMARVVRKFFRAAPLAVKLSLARRFPLALAKNVVLPRKSR
jgi:glycosyltransferase involved in cell wall biosynthesis